MKKSTKKTSTARKLMPAFAMLAVSAMSLSSVTYAWFSLSKDVTVSGMQIKATSEGGLLIINESTDANENWKTSVTASHTGLIDSETVALLPTSTEDASNWYYATSTDYDDAKAHQTASGAYTKLTIAKDSNGVGKSDGYTNGFYLANDFWIKSSGAAITNNQLQIQDLQVTGSTADKNLDKALRVAVVFNNSTAYIYNPLNSSNPSYYVNNGDVFTPTVLPTTTATDTGVSSIPSSAAKKTGGTEDAIKATVYLYFEGEDANCKSSNLTTTLDNLSVSIKFGLKNASSNLTGESGAAPAQQSGNNEGNSGESGGGESGGGNEGSGS